MPNGEEQTDKPWKLRGVSLEVALFVGVAFLAGAVVAVAVDLLSKGGSDWPTLQAWTLVPQTAACAGLLIVGSRRGSVAFYVLSGLIGLIVIEEAFHVLNPVAAWLSRMATWVLVYGLVAVVGLAGLAFSHWIGSSDERPVVRSMGGLLLVAGFFGGPMAVVSSAVRPTRGWILIEESGEAVAFAVIGGYAAGLVMHLARQPTKRRSAGPTHP